jgi:hypothetical protein
METQRTRSLLPSLTQNPKLEIRSKLEIANPGMPERAGPGFAIRSDFEFQILALEHLFGFAFATR